MYELFTQTFDTSDFPARWHCGNWTSAHGWTHIVSDVAIFAAYAAIPIALGIFATRRRDVPFLPIVWLFVAFILLCGFSHLVEATIFWKPWYRFSALVKACTAVVSWATVVALLPVIPTAMSLPVLAADNIRLESEVVERRSTESRLEEEIRRNRAARRQLEESYDDLSLFTNGMLDREDRLIALKAEVNELLAELQRKPRYSVESTDE